MLWRSFLGWFDGKHIQNWFLESSGQFNNSLRISILIQIQEILDEILKTFLDISFHIPQVVIYGLFVCFEGKIPFL